MSTPGLLPSDSAGGLVRSVGHRQSALFFARWRAIEQRQSGACVEWLTSDL